MTDMAKIAGILATWFSAVLLVLFVLFTFGWGAVFVLFALFAFYGWIIYSFLFYRVCRREELLYLFASAAEGGVPLDAALHAYLQDRPRGEMRAFWLATLLCVFPVPGFYWIWYRRTNFDRKVEELARQLEQGVPLFRVLQASPALATRDTVLAAAIGETTGQLPRCLRGVAQRRISTAWVEMLPQIVYPFVLLIVITGIVSFLGYFIVPKFKRIFQDFGVSMPPTTEILLHQSDLIVSYGWAIAIAIQLVVATALVLVLSSSARWFFPGLSSIYRRMVRSRVLQTLSLLLQVGKPMPESLAVLSSLPMGSMALRLLDRARARIEQGEPFDESLFQVGLLPASMLPLVRAAVRAGNLPWALAEMADALYHRMMRNMQRIVQAVFPFVVILFGGVVAFIVIAMFLPLVKLITELSE
jgi:type II secretory pathway component PulF